MKASLNFFKDQTMDRPAKIDRKVEGRLISKASRGDEGAFEELMLLNSEKIKAFIQKRGGRDTDWEECFQVTQFKAWKNLKKFKRTSSFSTWACRIAINLIIDEYRRSSLKNNTISISENERFLGSSFFDSTAIRYGLFHINKGIENLDEKDVSGAIRECISKISPEHQKVLELFFFEEMKYEEIAKRLKISLGTVMSRIFYAKKSLRKTFGYHFSREEFV